jgi:hypothetical protein
MRSRWNACFRIQPSVCHGSTTGLAATRSYSSPTPRGTPGAGSGSDAGGASTSEEGGPWAAPAESVASPVAAPAESAARQQPGAAGGP